MTIEKNCCADSKQLNLSLKCCWLNLGSWNPILFSVVWSVSTKYGRFVSIILYFIFRFGCIHLLSVYLLTLRIPVQFSSKMWLDRWNQSCNWPKKIRADRFWLRRIKPQKIESNSECSLFTLLENNHFFTQPQLW